MEISRAKNGYVMLNSNILCVCILFTITSLKQIQIEKNSASKMNQKCLERTVLGLGSRCFKKLLKLAI